MTAARRALFLDRDGVINVDHGYVVTAERTEFLEGIFELCARARQLGYLIVVVTNQAGIARGLYSESAFLDYMKWMGAVFVDHGAGLDAVYYCPHHPVEGIGTYLRSCDCRKPEPGMLLKARHDWNIDMQRSLLVGDKPSDVDAGRRAGVAECFRIEPVRAISGRMRIAESDLQEINAALTRGVVDGVAAP